MCSPEECAWSQRKTILVDYLATSLQSDGRAEIHTGGISTGPKYLGCHWVSDMIFLFWPQGGLNILYVMSLCNFTCVHLHTEAAMEPSSDTAIFTKKQVQKEMERLTTELQLVTIQRNELKDYLIFITEGTMEVRYPSFPTPWDCQ